MLPVVYGHSEVQKKEYRNVPSFWGTQKEEYITTEIKRHYQIRKASEFTSKYSRDYCEIGGTRAVDSGFVRPFVLNESWLISKTGYSSFDFTDCYFVGLQKELHYFIAVNNDEGNHCIKYLKSTKEVSREELSKELSIDTGKIGTYLCSFCYSDFCLVGTFCLKKSTDYDSDYSPSRTDVILQSEKTVNLDKSEIERALSAIWMKSQQKKY
ncbi:hypothetical protein TUMEXPCC7403_19265 [Tumidithrix helvetica PCC 7403]|uniref:hypothetical protein n=1 Tax=Tumidithrix helvetica TaxID=3457545 RepID=UPI003CA4FCD3